MMLLLLGFRVANLDKPEGLSSGLLYDVGFFLVREIMYVSAVNGFIIKGVFPYFWIAVLEGKICW